MSLPLTRRIARAALLIAAGAAPVVGAAGAASAAGLESVPQLGQLTATDGAATTDAATDAVGGATKTLPAPAADLAGTTQGLLGGLPAAQELPVSALPTSGVLPAGLAGGLPSAG
ncbi:ATP-binding protein [Streptomyces sp. NPDC085639]|uniref:ATP-binding protein n=1 Tax=Streptomyces sp. NPDC085639 TaxID=3365734 RepID=UPI0037CD450B